MSGKLLHVPGLYSIFQQPLTVLCECSCTLHEASLLFSTGGNFLAGLISGEDTVAVHVTERSSGSGRTAVATLTATHAGPWGLGVYVQTPDGQCVIAPAVCPCHMSSGRS